MGNNSIPLKATLQFMVIFCVSSNADMFLTMVDPPLEKEGPGPCDLRRYCLHAYLTDGRTGFRLV
jgi:hypothetical protein